MAEKQVKNKKESKFYYDAVNVRIRKLMDKEKTKTEDFANKIGISSAAVRMWYTGYSRPDIDKIPAICDFFDVTADYLLGRASLPTSEKTNIQSATGLSDEAIERLFEMRLNSKLSDMASKFIALEGFPLLMGRLNDLAEAFAYWKYLTDGKEEKEIEEMERNFHNLNDIDSMYFTNPAEKIDLYHYIALKEAEGMISAVIEKSYIPYLSKLKSNKEERKERIKAQKEAPNGNHPQTK